MLHIPLLPRDRLLAAALIACAVAGSTPLHAQSTTPVREDPNARTLLSGLVVPFVNVNERVQDVQARAELFVLGVQSGIALGISTFPLGTGSAGFAFVRDAATGERLLKSDSFGPVFVDRPLTGGKGQFGVGFHYQRMSFDKLQGIDLREEGIPTYDNEVIFLRDGFLQFERERLLIDSTADVFVLTSTFGVTDALDIGVGVPIVSLDITGQRIRDFDFSYDYQDNTPGLRQIVPGPTGRRIIDSRHASAAGLGDMSIRIKYAFGSGTKQPVAAALDLRLPTGDEDNLLGTGKFGAKLQLLAAQPIGSFMNVYGVGGYTFNDLSDQVNYGAAMDFVLLPRKQLTLSVDLIGETLRDSITDLETVPAYPPGDGFLPGFEARGLRRTSFDRYFFETGSVSMLRAGVGAKLHLGGNVLLTGSVLFPLNDNGFSAGVTPFIGIEKTFAR